MTTPSKSVVSQDLILAARQGLIPVRDHALGGFGNMLRKELGQWWGTRTWWIQILIWALILNGVSTIVMLTEEAAPIEMQFTLLEVVVQTFLPMAVGVVAIGTVIAAQGAIVGEKELGTAAWVLSKPASRSAFILAKLVSLTLGFWITALIVPAVVFVITTRILIPAPLDLMQFLAGLGVAMLSQLFYVALSLMLGSFFKSRGPIAGIGIAVIMTGLLLKGFIPLQALIVTPWPLGDISAGLALGSELPSIWWVPVVAVSVEIIVMVALALRRFQREEF